MKAYIIIVTIFMLGLINSFAEAQASVLKKDAEHSEYIRLKGFDQFNRKKIDFENQRLSGEEAYLRRMQHEEAARLKALNEHKKETKATSPQEGGAEYQEYLRSKTAEMKKEQYHPTQPQFHREGHSDLVSEEEELGLNIQRPRFDFKKREMYCEGSSCKSMKGSYSGSGGGRNDSGARPTFPPPSGNPSFDPNNQFNQFPPPPRFDEFDDDFAPPPPSGIFDREDIPPPPPPMIFDGE